MSNFTCLALWHCTHHVIYHQSPATTTTFTLLRLSHQLSHSNKSKTQNKKTQGKEEQGETYIRNRFAAAAVNKQPSHHHYPTRTNSDACTQTCATSPPRLKEGARERGGESQKNERKKKRSHGRKKERNHQKNLRLRPVSAFFFCAPALPPPKRCSSSILAMTNSNSSLR